MIMMAGAVHIMHQNVAHDWQMLTVSIIDTTIWVAQLLEGSLAAAVHWLKATITVQGLVGCRGSAVLAALSAYLPPAEHMMHLSNAALCAKQTAISCRHVTTWEKGCRLQLVLLTTCCNA